MFAPGLTTGDVFLLIFLMCLPIGLMILAYKARHPWILFPALVMWLVFALWCNDRVDPAYPDMLDMFEILRLMAVAMAFASAAMFFIIRPKIVGEQELSDREEYLRELREFRQQVNEQRELGIQSRKPKRLRTILYGRRTGKR